MPVAKTTPPVAEPALSEYQVYYAIIRQIPRAHEEDLEEACTPPKRWTGELADAGLSW